MKKKVALNFSVPLDFAAGFCQVLKAGQVPVLLPNLQHGTFKNFLSEYDEVLSVAEALPEDINFTDYTDTEIILFTSGSDGNPKKISKRLSHLLSEINEIEKNLGAIAGSSPVYSTVAPNHIYGLLFAILWPLVTGRKPGEVFVTIPEQLELLAKEHQNFVLISSPAYLQRLELNPLPSDSCRLVTSSGSLLGMVGVQNSQRILGVTPYEIYGSTESGGIAWRQQTAQNPNGLWRRLDVVRLSVLPESSQLKVSSPFFSEAEVLMGDRVELVDDHHFFLMGRVDRIVKIEGKRLSLTQMELSLRQNEYIADTVVVLEADRREQVACVAVLNESGKLALKGQGVEVFKKGLRDYLLQTFERVVLPKKFRFIDVIPRNAQNKTDHELLRLVLK